ncbi:MAG TPA: PEP/pyruvate-binding domain-containing protein [Bryobacteraceae bacterium]|nr:PEP/pyruvate-binding domain-containing protein [Bryobacteraceae bacterium]
MNHCLTVAAASAADASRFGPKAANLALLKQAGLPVPDGFCLSAEAYRLQVGALGLEAEARGVFGATSSPQARRHALAMKLGLLDRPIVPEIHQPLVAAWRDLTRRAGALTVVRSSALVEDRFGSSFAGQFESFLGLESEADFLTAVRSCWGALWTTRALRYMASREIDPADTAMAVLVQPLVSARAAGGGLSRAGEGMLLSATWGLGSAIAQGEVTPDRYELTRHGELLSVTPGRKDHQVGCIHRQEPAARAVPSALAVKPCLSEAEAVELGRLLKRVEELMGIPVEIEWAIDRNGFQLLQARPLRIQPAAVPDAIWQGRPRLNGHPAGIGWTTGRACVVHCECEMSRVAPGDILVTKVAGPALSHILTHVAGVVTERGGSTSHMASLARERGIPMVLGVPEATLRIPDGSLVAIDGVAGVIRWLA